MMRKGCILLIAAVLLLGAACRRIEEPSHGIVTLTFRVGGPATRAETPGDGNVADGGGIFCTKSGDVVTPDLVIFIFNEDGSLKKRYPTDGELVESDYDNGHATTLSISFGSTSSDGWADGTYSVFALANIAGTGGNLDIPDLSTITSISQLENLQLGISSGGSSPRVGDRMPLTASGTLHVAKGLYNKYNGLLELEMLRCFAKVQLTFRNLTGETLTLNECAVTFKDMNTQKAWLFPTDPDFVELGVVTGTKDSNYSDYATVLATDINSADLTNIPFTDNLSTDTVDEREREAFVKPLLFFPSIAPRQTVPSAGNRYLCDISFKVGTATTAKTFTNLPIHDEYTRDILELKRNQYLQILTTISKGSEVSFNFFVKEWEEKTEIVIFH